MAMGGGSMMRAAAKVAGIGVVNTGFRSGSGGVIPESPFSAAARAAARPIGETISVKAASSSSAASVEKPAGWVEIDDWEFAGVEDGDHPLPRLVFGGAPTVDEAKEATTELKDALEKVFVTSPRSGGYESLYGVGHSSGLSQLSDSEVIENKACLTSAYSTPNHAIQAFKFLDQSPEVQGVVASIASDPTVWEAVLQNPALQGYLHSHCVTYSNVYQNVGESLAEGEVLYQECPKSFEVYSESGKADGSKTGDSNASTESDSKNELLDIWKNVKLRVADMMSNLSDYFNSLFGVEGEKKVDADTDLFPPFIGKILGPSLMGVVVMVIMVVVLKRA